LFSQSVLCKITNIDSSKERFLVSLKQADVGAEESMAG
jgi:ribosomal protein S1